MSGGVDNGGDAKERQGEHELRVRVSEVEPRHGPASAVRWGHSPWGHISTVCFA